MIRTKVILASLALAVSVAALALTAWANKPMDPFFEANLHAMLSSEGSSGCISGGPNASACELGGNIEIPGLGTGISCAVTCNENSYACCSITGCHCIEIEK